MRRIWIAALSAVLLLSACARQGGPAPAGEQTLRLALKLNADTAQFYPLIPYPGTGAYDRAKQKGHITADYENYCLPDGTHNTVLTLPELSAQEMVEFCNKARRRYYLRPRYILHRIKVGVTNPDDLKRSLKAFGMLRHFLFK